MITSVDDPMTERKDTDVSYQALFQSMDDGFCVIDVLFDDNGKPIDWRYLETNLAFNRQGGLPDAAGHLASEVFGKPEANWLEFYGAVAMTGIPARTEDESRTLNKWYDVSAFKVGNGDSRKVAVLFRDITEQKRMQEALGESEAKYRELVKHAPAGIYEIDFRTKRFTSVNDVMCHLTGYSREEFLSMDASQLLDEKSTMVFQERIRQWLNGKKPDPIIDYTVRTKDGRIKYALLDVHFTVDEYGMPMGATAIAHDITERKKMEEELEHKSIELQKKEEENLQILDGSCEGSWIVDLAAGTIQCSEKWSKRLGLDLVPEEDRLAFTRTLAHPDDQSYENTVYYAMDRKMPRFDLEYRIKTVDAGYIWTQNRGKIVYDERGNALKVFAVTTDITVRKQAEEAKERLIALMDHNPSLVFLKDEEGRYVYLNKTYEKSFIPSGNWHGKTDFDFWPKESAEMFRANDADVLNSGRTHQLMEDSTDMEGRRYCWLNYKFPFTDSNNRKYVGGIGIDATRLIQAEEALRESEERYMKVNTLAPYAICLMRYPELTIEQVNAAYERMFELNSGEAMGKTPDELEISLDTEGRVRMFSEVLKNGSVHAWELEYATRSGKKCVGSFSFNLIMIGGQRYMLGAGIDITERKKMEEALRESEDLFRVLIQNVKSGVALVDKTGKFLVVNPAFMQMYGLTRESDIHNVNSQDWTRWNIYGRDSRLLSSDEYLVGKALRTGKPVRDELVGVQNPGAEKITWMLVSTEPLLKEDGNVFRVICTYHDITERKKAEEELAYQARLLSGVHDAITASDENYNITYWSKTAEQLFGWKAEEVIGKHSAGIFRTVVPDSSRSEAIEKMLRDDFYEGEVIYHHKDGREIYTHVQAQVLRDKMGNLSGNVSFFRDITKRKRAEETLRESEEQLAKLNVDLAAEVNILNTLYGISSRFIKDADTDTVYKYILEAVISLTGADCGNMQMVSDDGKTLEIVSHKGYSEEFIRRYKRIFGDRTVCLKAMEDKSRIIEEDMPHSPIFGDEDRRFMKGEGLICVQSTPIFSAAGDLLGIISTHYKSPHKFDEQELRVIDLLSHQAADVIEKIMEEGSLRESRAFQLKLDDALKTIEDPVQIQFTACRVLGEHIGVSRVLYGDIIDEKVCVISRDYVNGVPSLACTLNAADFGQFTVDHYKSGLPVIIDDVSTDDRLSEEERNAFHPIQTAANMSLGLIKGGKWVAAFGAHHNKPKHWTSTEISLIELTAERTWEAVTRARAEESEKKAMGLVKALRASEERQAFLLKLSDALRPLSDPTDIHTAVTRVAMDYLKSDRCYYCEVINDNAIIRQDASCGDLPSVAGVYPLASLPIHKSLLESGKPFTVTDVKTTDMVDEELRRLCIQLKVISYLDVPVLKNGKLTGILCIVQSTPREWTDTEAELAVEVAERTWAAVERACVETALRESEENYRALFENAEYGLVVFEPLFDENGRVADLRYMQITPAFEKETGLRIADFKGKILKDIFPEMEQHWFDVFDQVVKSGKPMHYEDYNHDTDRWYQVNVFSYPNGLVGEQFIDITQRKRREMNATILDEIGKDLSVLTAPDDIMQTVGERLGKYLQASACIFADVDEAKNEATIHHGWNSADVPSLKQTFRLADYFGEEFRRAGRAGEAVIVGDTAHDERADAEAYAKLQLGAFVTVPFQREGRWTANITVTSREPRDWRTDEIRLVQEIADRVFPRIERARAVEALHEADERFRTMADAAPVLIWETDVQGVVFTNRHYLDFFGVDFDAIRGMGWAGFLHPEDAASCITAYQGAFDRGESYIYECRFRRADGQYRWLHNTGQPFGEDRFVGSSIDITESKKLEEALRKSEEKFRVAQEISPDGFTILRPVRDGNGQITDFTCIYENDAVARINGTDPKAVIGQRLLELFPGHRGTPFLEAYIHTAGTGEPRIFEAEYGSESMTKPTWLRCVVVRMNGDIAILAQDITESKIMERELKRYTNELERKEQEYLEIIDGSSEGTFIQDLEKGETYYSHEWMKRLGMEGLSPKEATAAFDALIHPDDAGYVHKAYQDACDGKAQRIKVEFRAKTADGHFIWILGQAKIIYNRTGKPTKYLGTHMDVTGRKEMEIKLKRHASELDEKNRLVTEFFTNISHEFKTPLSVILIQLELMNLYLDEPAKLKEFIGAATQNSYRLNRLVGNLLDVTKIDAGYMKAYYQPADMVEAISQLVDSVRDYARKTGIEIEFKSRLASLYIPMDIEKMERVMLNLLSNAIKHTQRGGHIRVGLKETKSRVQISVRDDGEGIPEEKKNVIFDRFRQVNTSLTRNTEGTGIGLSLTKALIELMQGKIWFSSKAGKGSEFFIELPILNGEKLAKLPQMEGIGIGKKVAMEFSDLHIDT